MIEESRNRNFEYGFYALAFGLSISIRLLHLGEIPLGDNEARWALQALDLTKGQQFVMGSQPAYVILTAFAFFILQVSNFTARLVPAIFGAILTLAPYIFRDRLGKRPALVLAFLLAVDPGLLALSRQAGSPLLAVTALLFSWAAWRKENHRAAGIWIGIALLGGPLLWPGILGLALTYGLLRSPLVSGIQASPVETSLTSLGHNLFDRKSWITFAAFTAGTYILLGSCFLLVSGGLSAGLASIPIYFSGWVGPTSVPALRLLQGLVVYEFMAILVAIVGLVRGLIKRDGLVISLGVWLIVSSVLTIAYPFRQVADLVWLIIPLLTLASLEISRHFVPIQNGKWETLGMAVFTGAILFFAAQNYSAIALVSMDQSAAQLRWWILLGAIGMLMISIVMVALGWSVSTAVQGSVWGALSVLFLYTLSTSMASGGLRTYHTYELWPTGPYTGQAEALLAQMKDLSQWKSGVNASLDVTVSGVDSPALVWALRDWNPRVLPDSNLSGSTPSVVIAPAEFSSTEILSTYRGEDFTWRITPAWDQGLLPDWLRWSIMHDFPRSDEKIILWVRSDVFVDSQNSQ